MSSDRLAELAAAGVAIWLDDLSRQRLTSGGLDKLRREQHVVGVTTNPTIFAKAVTAAEDYAEQVKDLALRETSVPEAMRSIMAHDVRWACDVLKPAADASNGIDGRVSIEVDPALAANTHRTHAEAKELWWLVDRDNLFIKIPATQEGLPAITETLAKGISVNVTLIFSLQRYEAVINAFFDGLEQAKANGHDLSKIGSVASFFVSRVDTEYDKRLDKIGTDEAKALKGKAAIANAKLAYKLYEQLFSSDRWQALANAGAQPQRPLWASTSTKNPEYRDVIYVEELVAPGTVNTMPEAVIHAFADHGEVRPDAVTGSYAEAQQVMDALAALGIDYDDVVEVLEREGVEKFNVSGKEMIDTVQNALNSAS
ncbi:transaldolase [Dactylosporangium vinaceum]|uniref:Transaldolase n=1 Tax=Dactylosporangium vinaceum TaxID=53362 RepID=A0ABV5MBD3_9ACTN|nr:transaldolase [Dactylosporangium vinaceum]UAB98411.1 transaldolase [Dactylosporangium vinaceum]